MKNYRLHTGLYLGILGLIVFLLLRQSIDFNANAPVNQSIPEITTLSGILSEKLGFSTDSLNIVTLRSQHVNYFNNIKEQLEFDEQIKPSELNARGVNLSSWHILIGTNLEDGGTAIGVPGDLFNKAGKVSYRISNSGKLIQLKTNESFSNPTFVAGDSLFQIARKTVEQIFDYSLDSYTLEGVNISTDKGKKNRKSYQPENSGQNRLNQSEINTNTDNKITFRWQANTNVQPGPRKIDLVLQPRFKEAQSTGNGGGNLSYGASVVEFSALSLDGKDLLETEISLSDTNSLLLFYMGLALLIALVLFTGIKHIFRGEMEWRRTSIVLSVITTLVFAWRLIYFSNTYYNFYSGSIELVVMVSQLLYAFIMGLFAALAYAGWEALARHQNQKELPVVDALWNRRLFLRESGESILKGYALGGIILGIFATVLYGLGLYYYQFDSQFGFAEASNAPKLLTINMSSTINTFILTLGHVGIAGSIVHKYLADYKWIYYAAGILVTGFLLSSVGRIFALTGSFYQELLVFISLAAVLFTASRKIGLVSTGAAWWVMTNILLITPYLGSRNLGIAGVSYLQFAVMSIPLLFAIVSYRYGKSVADLEGYVPEYEERITNHLRVEKEIEIARESQFQLMPVAPPSIKGVDVFGFFIPSFEVGGDYFDYVVSTPNGTGEECLTLTIVDVSGKAMKAAMHAVFTSGLLLSRMHQDGPSHILRDVAPVIFKKTDPKTFITCQIARYCPQTGMLSMANAGHCEPIIKRGDTGKAEFLHFNEPRFPLGLKELVGYGTTEISINKGDLVLFYSDGLPEASNENNERFGFEETRLLIEQMDTDAMNSQQICREIKRTIQRFSKFQLADDTTIVCLKPV